MSELKSRLHELNKRDFLDDLSPKQLDELHEANAQYERGETKTHEEVLEWLKEWRSK